MKKAFPIILVLISISCAQQQNRDEDFIDKLLDLATATTSREYQGTEYVQLPNLYEELGHEIPDDQDEKLILVERLKKKGFEVTNWGRGNFPPLGPRIVIVELKKGSCVCEVSKVYYSTTVDTLYQRAEGINCKRV